MDAAAVHMRARARDEVYPRARAPLLLHRRCAAARAHLAAAQNSTAQRLWRTMMQPDR